MSDLNEGGTPKAEPDGTAASGGTPAAATDGTETAGLTEDQKNLLEAWKAKAAEGNEAKRRLREAEERLAEAERARYGQAQPVDPVSQAIANDVQLANLGDAEAISRVNLWRITAQQAQESRLNDELDELGVAGPERKRIKDAVKRSGYVMGVQEARQATRGAEAESLAEQNRKQAERIRALEAALNGRAPATPGNPATTGPSLPAQGAVALTLEEWQKLPREERDKMGIRPN